MKALENAVPIQPQSEDTYNPSALDSIHVSGKLSFLDFSTILQAIHVSIVSHTAEI